MLFGAYGMFNTVEAKKNKDDEGILIEITVLDAGTRTSTVVIKHTLASQPSKVNSVTGINDTESIDKNAAIHKLPGNVEEFSISASGYIKVVTYDVRRRNNVIG